MVQFHGHKQVMVLSNILLSFPKFLSSVLVGLHLGLNLNVMLIKLQNLIKNRVILKIVKVIIIVYGIYSFLKHDILKHITGYYDFAFSNCSFLANIVRYASIVLAIH